MKQSKNIIAPGFGKTPLFVIDTTVYVSWFGSVAKKITGISDEVLYGCHFKELFTESEKFPEMIRIGFAEGMESNFSLRFRLQM